MLPKTIVVATDFSEQAGRAVEYAVELARKVEARVYVVNAWTPPALLLPDVAAAYPEAVDEAAADAQRRLDALIVGYRGAQVSLEGVLRCGEPVDQVVGVARQLNADLIVVGTHGRTGLAHVVLGSVAESVVRTAPCAVLAVH